MFYKKERKTKQSEFRPDLSTNLGCLPLRHAWKYTLCFFHKTKTIKFDQVAKRPAKNMYKSAEQTSKSGKIALPQITAPYF